MNNEIFRQHSLEALKASLADGPYPTYPTERLTYENGAKRIGEYGPLYLPHGPWHMRSSHTKPDPEVSARLQLEGYKLDANGRPLHPWVHDMISDKDLGVVTGKGFYWQWGPNYTADPIVIRVDQDEPHVLLIKRRDTGSWALPGGFIDPEDLNALVAAKREANEEALIDLDDYSPYVSFIYRGPLADIRATANAWPETTAYSFVLPTNFSAALPLEQYPAGDDAEFAQWVAASEVNTVLRFGSHALMTTIALEQLRTA